MEALRLSCFRAWSCFTKRNEKTAKARPKCGSYAREYWVIEMPSFFCVEPGLLYKLWRIIQLISGCYELSNFQFSSSNLSSRLVRNYTTSFTISIKTSTDVLSFILSWYTVATITILAERLALKIPVFFFYVPPHRHTHWAWQHNRNSLCASERLSIKSESLLPLN